MSTPLLAAKLVELRQQFNYSQQEIADYLGVSRVAYSHYERNSREIPLEMIVKLCKLYKIDICDLVNEETVLTFSSSNSEKSIYPLETLGFSNNSINPLSVSSIFITKNIQHFLKLFTGKNSTIDFTNISKEDIDILAEYKKLDKQTQKEVRQFIKFKQQIKE